MLDNLELILLTIDEVVSWCVVYILTFFVIYGRIHALAADSLVAAIAWVRVGRMERG